MAENILFGGRVTVLCGDITEVAADAIVNAANSSLMGGGGVDGAIHRTGGPAILADCRRLRAQRFPDGLPAGQAVATGAGRLPAKYVIHTVGPVWHGGKRGEPELLSSCYRSCLELASALGCESIAFPAVSTGVYGYPATGAADVVRRTLDAYVADHPQPGRILLVFFSESAAAAFLDAS